MVANNSIILISISSLIFRTSSIGLFFGSGIDHSIMLLTNNAGHDCLSMQPMFTILLDFLIISSVSTFGFWSAMSIPISFMALMASGFIFSVGVVPALRGTYSIGAYLRKNPSAICLLPAFSIQTKRT